MKKIFYFLAIFLFLTSLFLPVIINAETYSPNRGLVPCGKAADGSDACTIGHFFIMLARIYDFMVKWIAAPLAILMICIGGVMMIISAGNQNLFGLGKKTLIWALIGLALVFCSWVLINFIMQTMGYQLGDWSKL